MDIQCPASMLPHVKKVLRGEYEIRYRHPKPVILDIGANVGSFAAWVQDRWPGSFTHCYEPLPANFSFLKQNLGHLEGSAIAFHNVAIGDTRKTRMFLGRNNCGEASFYDTGEQTDEWVDVVTQSPDTLPQADILKIDTEGSEIDILDNLPSIEYDVVLVEYHSEKNRRDVDILLCDYILVGGAIRCMDRGVLKFMHRRIVNAHTQNKT